VTPEPPRRGTHPKLTIALTGLFAYSCAAAIVENTTKTAVQAAESPSAGDLLGTVWGVVVLMVIVCWIVIVRPWARYVRITLAAMMAGVLIAAGVGTARVASYASSGFLAQVDRAQKQTQQKQQSAARQIALAAAGACQQTPVAGAGTAASPSDIHPLLILDETGTVYGRDAIVTHGWMPSSLNQLKAVVCIKAETRSTQTCSYTGGTSYQLTTYSRDVSIVEAGTGKQLATSTLNGRNGTCRERIVGGQIVSDESGDHVSPDDVADYIADTAKKQGGN